MKVRSLDGGGKDLDVKHNLLVSWMLSLNARTERERMQQ